MKLDADKLRAEAEAHQARMESPLWAPSDGRKADNWTEALKPGATVSEPPSSNAREYEPKSHSRSTNRGVFFTEDDSLLQPRQTPRDGIADPMTELLPRLDTLEHAIERLTAATARRSVGGSNMPAWLETAAGNPHTYDAPDADRAGVCVRILPTTYTQLQQIQRRMGLRTTAGAWELLLRLGLAAAERLPIYQPP